MNARSLLLNSCVALLLALPASAQPCSPKKVISDHVAWLSAAPRNRVRVTAVSNQQNRLVSYAEAPVRHRPAERHPLHGWPSLQGDGERERASVAVRHQPQKDVISLPINLK